MWSGVNTDIQIIQVCQPAVLTNQMEIAPCLFQWRQRRTHLLLSRSNKHCECDGPWSRWQRCDNSIGWLDGYPSLVWDCFCRRAILSIRELIFFTLAQCTMFSHSSPDRVCCCYSGNVQLGLIFETSCTRNSKSQCFMYKPKVPD